VSEAEAIAIPQMLGLDALTKILVAYLKAGGDKEEKKANDVAEISGVAANNVSLNNKFFASIGLLQGTRGVYKLTDVGIRYATALDWGRLDEAKRILAEVLKGRPLVVKTLSYVEINQPVTKDDLIGKIAFLAYVRNEPRYQVGIKAFVEMLTMSSLLTEDKDGKITAERRQLHEELKPTTPKVAKETITRAPATLPLSITINIGEHTEIDKIKAMIRAVREALSED